MVAGRRGRYIYGGPRFPSPGYGTVFELMPDDKGGWTEKIIYAFGSSIDGGYPEGGLILDAAGNLYGTTVAGGTGSFSGNGTAFELTPIANGHWKQSVLHNFSSKGKEDGYWPASGLVMDATGNLYGTTQWGGTYDYGTVFELTPVGDGRWTETILHNFKLDGFDGLFPSLGALSFDSVGNLYGATSGLWGTVYQLTPAADGTWAERILHTFANAGDGWYPYADLAVDRSGNIYGTTNSQHNSGSYGNVFEITP